MLFILLYNISFLAIFILSVISIVYLDKDSKNSQTSWNLILSSIILSIFILILIDFLLYFKFFTVDRSEISFSVTIIILTILCYFSYYYLEKERTGNSDYDSKKEELKEVTNNTNLLEQNLSISSFIVGIITLAVFMLITFGKIFYSEEKTKTVWIKEPVYIIDEKTNTKEKRKFIV